MNQLSFRLLSLKNLILICLGLFTGCEEVPVPLTTNSVITGRGSFGTGGDYSGIMVTANGPYGQTPALTDVKGYFTITGLGNGTYFLEYSKKGYGTIRQYGIQLFGNDTVQTGNVTMYQLPDSLMLPSFRKTYIDLRPRFGQERLWICFDTNITKQNAYLFGFQFLLCMSTDKYVSIDHNQLIWFGWDGQYNGDNYSIYIDLKTFSPSGFSYREKFPFKSGDEIFVRGYPCNKGEQGGYLDTYLGKHQYSTLDRTRSTNVISFILP